MQTECGGSASSGSHYTKRAGEDPVPWGAGRPPSSITAPRRVDLAGTVCAPQIAPCSKAGTRAPPCCLCTPHGPFRRASRAPSGCGEDSLPCPWDAGGALAGRHPRGWVPALALLWRFTPSLGAVLRVWGSWGCAPARDVGQDLEDAVQAMHRGRHCRQESDGQEGGGLLAPAFCLIRRDIPLASGSLTLLCFLFISTGQETADL